MVKFNENLVARFARRLYKHKSPIHPWEHLERVAMYAKMLAKEHCPQYMNDAIIAAYFHDIGRVDDEAGSAHAIAGAEITTRILKKYAPRLYPECHMDTIIFAIKHHGDHQAPNGGYPTVDNYPEIRAKNLIKDLIACLWDADRLDLARFIYFIPLRVEFFSTPMAKTFVNSHEHLKLYKRIAIDVL